MSTPHRRASRCTRDLDAARARRAPRARRERGQQRGVGVDRHPAEALEERRTETSPTLQAPRSGAKTEAARTTTRPTPRASRSPRAARPQSGPRRAISSAPIPGRSLTTPTTCPERAASRREERREVRARPETRTTMRRSARAGRADRSVFARAYLATRPARHNGSGERAAAQASTDVGRPRGPWPARRAGALVACSSRACCPCRSPRDDGFALWALYWHRDAAACAAPRARHECPPHGRDLSAALLVISTGSVALVWPVQKAWQDCRSRAVTLEAVEECDRTQRVELEEHLRRLTGLDRSR